MTGFELLKFLHVVAVIGWVGTAIGLAFLQARLTQAEDRTTLMGVGRQMASFGKIYFSPLAATTLVTGILMIATTNGLSFGDPWVVIGIGGIAVSLGLGLGLITPTGKKLVEASQQTPPDGATMAGLSQRMKTLTLINIAVLLFVVFAMVTKLGA